MVVAFDAVPAPATAGARAVGAGPPPSTGRGDPQLSSAQASAAEQPTEAQQADQQPSRGRIDEGHGSADPLRVAGRRARGLLPDGARSPKREEASKLADEVEHSEASIAQQEQVVEFAEQAKQDFPALLRTPGGARQGGSRAGGLRLPPCSAEPDLLQRRRRIPGPPARRGIDRGELRPPPPGPRRRRAASVEPSATDVPPGGEAAAARPRAPARPRARARPRPPGRQPPAPPDPRDRGHRRLAADRGGGWPRRSADAPL